MDKNGLINTKLIIELLIGNKKYDVDEKFDKDRIIKFFDSIVETHSEEENALLDALESSLQGNTVYKEDLENPIYLKIVGYFKELKETNKERKKLKRKNKNFIYNLEIKIFLIIFLKKFFIKI